MHDLTVFLFFVSSFFINQKCINAHRDINLKLCLYCLFMSMLLHLLILPLPMSCFLCNAFSHTLSALLTHSLLTMEHICHVVRMTVSGHRG